MMTLIYVYNDDHCTRRATPSGTDLPSTGNRIARERSGAFLKEKKGNTVDHLESRSLPLFSLGTTRTSLVGFGPADCPETRKRRVRRYRVWKEKKRTPGTRNAILGMRANSLDTAYSPLEKRKRRDRVSRFARESQTTPSSPGDEGDQARAD